MAALSASITAATGTATCGGARAALSGAPWPKLPAVAAEDVDDGELMLRYAGGDARAFEALYQRIRAPLWRFVCRQLRDETIAADVFQETWTRVIAHRNRYQRRAQFSTWIYRIAHNCCVDHWRRSGRRQQRELADAGDALDSIADEMSPTPAVIAETEQSAALLREALARLPEPQREAFLLYAEAGLEIAAIAEVTGVGAETAKSRLRYAVAKLKRQLAAEPAGESGT